MLALAARVDSDNSNLVISPSKRARRVINHFKEEGIRIVLMQARLTIPLNLHYGRLLPNSVCPGCRACGSTFLDVQAWRGL